MRMAVSEGWKYVYVHDHPAQLFDLSADPDELENRIDDPACAAIRERLRAAVLDGWDPVEVCARVLDSQQRRRWINESSETGTGAAWDIQPDFDAREQYVRSHDAEETARRQRWPRWQD